MRSARPAAEDGYNGSGYVTRVSSVTSWQRVVCAINQPAVRSSGGKASAAALVKVLHADRVEGVQSLAKFEGLLAVFCYMTTCHLVYRYPSFVVSRSEHSWSSPGVTLRGIVVDPEDFISKVHPNITRS